MELEGEGKMPVMHFGMTGMLQVVPWSFTVLRTIFIPCGP